MDKLKPFKRNETCFYLLGNRVHEGKVKAEFRLDDVNVKYLVANGGGNVWMFDHHLYHSLKELFDDLRSCIIK